MGRDIGDRFFQEIDELKFRRKGFIRGVDAFGKSEERNDGGAGFAERGGLGKSLGIPERVEQSDVGGALAGVVVQVEELVPSKGSAAKGKFQLLLVELDTKFS